MPDTPTSYSFLPSQAPSKDADCLEFRHSSASKVPVSDFPTAASRPRTERDCLEAQHSSASSVPADCAPTGNGCPEKNGDSCHFQQQQQQQHLSEPKVPDESFLTSCCRLQDDRDFSHFQQQQHSSEPNARGESVLEVDPGIPDERISSGWKVSVAVRHRRCGTCARAPSQSARAPHGPHGRAALRSWGRPASGPSARVWYRALVLAL